MIEMGKSEQISLLNALVRETLDSMVAKISEGLVPAHWTEKHVRHWATARMAVLANQAPMGRTEKREFAAEMKENNL